MAYLKQNWFTKNIFNPIAMMTGIAGTEALSVKGRKSGKDVRIPVIPVDVDGARYLVSTRGESDWVRNIRAAGGGEIKRKGETSAFRATEVPVGERGPVIEAYRKKAGSQVEGYWKSLPDAADHPVFRMEGG